MDTDLKITNPKLYRARALHPEAKLEDAIKFAQDEDINRK